MNSYWHFMTNLGDIFTIREYNPQSDLIRSVGVYFQDEKGKRNFLGKNYSKKIDEFGENWVKEKYPHYINLDNEDVKILVPIQDIQLFFDPFAISNQMKDRMKKTKWGDLIKLLEKLVPKEDIGFIGSYLIGFPQEDSDIDIIIRGIENLNIIKKEFPNILKKLNANNNLDDFLVKVSLEKYHSIYSKENNDFLSMVKNRWPTIKTKEYMTKIRFTPKENEIEIPHISGNKIKDIEIEGEVINDIGTNFMPRFFKVKCEKENYDVLTYFWDYTYCVKKGDKIKVKGKLFKENKILISDKKENGILFY